MQRKATRQPEPDRSNTPPSSPQPEATSTLPTPPTWLAAALLAVLTAVAFLPSCRSEFLDYDDQDYVTANAHVQAGLTAESMRWALTATHAANWHPLTWWSLQLDFALYGLNPTGYHVTNVVLHVVTAVLLFLALHALTEAVWPSLIAAAIFAVHPQRVESVVWVAERKDVLSGMFWMLTLLTYAWYARAPRWPRYLSVVGAMALGLMAKPMLVTLPFVLLLLDYWPLQRLSRSNAGWRVLEKLPLFALAAASSVVTVLAQKAALAPVEQITFAMRAANALCAYVEYLRKLLWPAGLVAHYPHGFRELASAEVILAAVVLAGITAVAVWQARRRPYLLVGWLWYLGTLVPVIGLVQVGAQGMADRYTYIPSIGVILALVWLLTDLAARGPKEKLAPILAVIAALGILTYGVWQLGAHWKNTESLWRHAVAVDPHNPAAHRFLANELVRNGRYDEALEHYREALAYAHFPETIHNDLALMYMETGRFADATEEFHRCLAYGRDDPVVHHNLGACLVFQKRYAEAEAHLKQALEALRDDASVHFHLAVACAGQRRLSEARAHFARGRDLEPDNADAHLAFGVALRSAGAPADALTYLGTARRLKPRHPEILHELGLAHAALAQPRVALDRFLEAVQLAPRSVVYLRSLAQGYFALEQADKGRSHYDEATRLYPGWLKAVQQEAWNRATNPDAAARNGLEAVRLAEQICQATRFEAPLFADTLAAAYAEAGRFEDAATLARKAEAQAEARGEGNLARAIAQRIQLYEAHKPYRTPSPR